MSDRMSEWTNDPPDDDAIHVIAISKGSKPNFERFVFIFRKTSREQLRAVLIAWLDDPEIDFTLYDANEVLKRTVPIFEGLQ